MKDWIIWQPKGSIWHPDNLNKVWSRGIELFFKNEFRLNNFRYSANIHYNYMLSTQEDAEAMYNHKQLIYVPRQKANLGIAVIYKLFKIHYIFNYTGKRYVLADNSDEIKPYWLGNLIFHKDFELSKTTFNLSLHVNNLWGTTYYVMKNYPMPLRHYKVSLSFNLN